MQKKSVFVSQDFFTQNGAPLSATAIEEQGRAQTNQLNNESPLRGLSGCYSKLNPIMRGSKHLKTYQSDFTCFALAFRKQGWDLHPLYRAPKSSPVSNVPVSPVYNFRIALFVYLVIQLVVEKKLTFLRRNSDIYFFQIFAFVNRLAVSRKRGKENYKIAIIKI